MQVSTSNATPILKVIWVFIPHGSVVINSGCKSNDLNLEVAVEVELVS